jgi:hypothetical protein
MLRILLSSGVRHEDFPMIMKPIAPGSIIFHPHRGYGVLTAVNLLTGWVGARFGNEVHVLDLSLSEDNLSHADGEPILFRRSAPAYMPHARLMEMVRYLHAAGYERIYLYVWPKPSGLHWRWQLFTGPRLGTQFWAQRPLRPGWHGSGSDYNFNPVMGWGDAPGASAPELANALARFDPEAMARASGRDEKHTEWFACVCDALLPDFAYSLGWDNPGASRHDRRLEMPSRLPVMPVRRGVPAYKGPALPWPPGWLDGWAHHGYHRVLGRPV